MKQFQHIYTCNVPTYTYYICYMCNIHTFPFSKPICYQVVTSLRVFAPPVDISGTAYVDISSNVPYSLLMLLFFIQAKKMY